MPKWLLAPDSTPVVLLALFLLGEAARRTLPWLRGVGVPTSVVGGLLGLLVGPSVLGWVALDIELLEAVVYHGLAVVFVAVSLQAPDGDTAARHAETMAFGIVAISSLQTGLGLAIVLLLGLVAGEALHPGLGLLLPLGFEQGPGQALAMGRAWQTAGLEDGGAIGLIVAAVGYGWSVVVGVPLVAWGRRRGLWTTEREALTDGSARSIAQRGSRPGALLAIVAVYAATLLLCTLLAAMLARWPAVAAMIWGFHFMVGALLALLVRPYLGRLGGQPDPATLSGVARVTVDVATVAALSAVQLAVLKAHWVPIVVITTAGGLATLAAVLFFARRGFRGEAFEHAVVWFGMSTGTLPMGLALLRVIDPDLRSSAPVSVVVGSSLAIVPLVPLVLVLPPAVVAAFAEHGALATSTGLVLALTYFVVTVVVWTRVGGLSFSGPAPDWAGRVGR